MIDQSVQVGDFSTGLEHLMGTPVDISEQRKSRGKTKPQKYAGESTTVSEADFMSDDEVTNLLAVKNRLAEMLARPDVHERDFAAINKDYRKVIVELQEARDRVNARGLGARSGLRVAGGRAIDGDI